jgi:DNA-binding SARP family transcriptional activator/tetratricopeptide (TPR) repeat protein
MSFTAQPVRDGLQINLLGTLEVLRDGQRHSLPASRKARGLLAYLVVAAGRPFRREDLCDLLWEDVADPRAELRWYISRLRAVMGSSLIASRDTVAITPDGLTVDAVVFRHLAAASASRREAEQALKLWRGQPLADAEVDGSYRFHTWWLAEREALSALHRGLLHNIVDLSWPSPDDALASARHLVAQYPLDQWGHGRVSQALERVGRAIDARTYITETQRALSLELDVPMTSIMTTLPAEPCPPGRSLPAARTTERRPLLGVMPLQVLPNDEVLQAMAVHVASEISHGLWRTNVCDVVEPDGGCTPNLAYAVRGKLLLVGEGLALSLCCDSTQSGAAIWYGRFGPDRCITHRLKGWLGRAIGAIQSSIQLTEMERVTRLRRGEDRPIRDLMLEAYALAHTLEPNANQRALMLVDTVMNDDPDSARALALAAWCHAQRSVYNWSTNADADRENVRDFVTSATLLGQGDPECLTMAGTARSLIGEFNAAETLLTRAVQLNPHSGWTQSRRGWLAVYLDKPEPAIRYFREAIRLAPMDPAIFNSMVGLGVAYFIKGQFKPAVYWMEKGLALNPRAVWTYRNLVPAYIATGDQAGGERGITCLLNEYPSFNIAAACSAMVFSRPTMARLQDGLSRAGLSRV